MKSTLETMCKQMHQSFITNKQFATAKQWNKLHIAAVTARKAAAIKPWQ